MTLFIKSGTKLSKLNNKRLKKCDPLQKLKKVKKSKVVQHSKP